MKNTENSALAKAIIAIARLNPQEVEALVSLVNKTGFGTELASPQENFSGEPAPMPTPENTKELSEYSDKELYALISAYLKNFGMQTSLSGYSILIELLTLKIRKPEECSSNITEDYSKVGISRLRTERNIRDAIKNAFKLHPERFDVFFGICPTNKEFISYSIEYLSLHH